MSDQPTGSLFIVRLAKIILVIFVGLHGSLLSMSNILNWPHATPGVTEILSQQGNIEYSHSLMPQITSPLLITCALLLIIIGEMLIGIVCAKGAYDMARGLRRPSADFNRAKQFAILGCCMPLFVWFCGFMTIGNGGFLMFQSELGAAVLRNAFVYMASGALILLFVNQPDS